MADKRKSSEPNAVDVFAAFVEGYPVDDGIEINPPIREDAETVGANDQRLDPMPSDPIDWELWIRHDPMRLYAQSRSKVSDRDVQCSARASEKIVRRISSWGVNPSIYDNSILFLAIRAANQRLCLIETAPEGFLDAQSVAAKIGFPIGHSAVRLENAKDTIWSNGGLAEIVSLYGLLYLTDKFDIDRQSRVKRPYADGFPNEEQPQAAPTEVSLENTDSILDIFKVAHDNEALGSLLRHYRRKAGLTQDDVANVTGQSRTNIANIERGKVDPKWSTIRAMVNAIQSVPA